MTAVATVAGPDAAPADGAPAAAAPPTTALLRVAVLSVEECIHAVDTGDTSGIDFLDRALQLAGEFTSYRHKITDFDDLATRYISRMGGRATPFGLFAGVAPLRVARHRRLDLAPRSDHQVRVRLDAGALEAVVTSAGEARAGSVPLRPNPVLQRRHGQVRYSKTGNANAAIVELRETDAIRRILELCASRPLSADALVEALDPAGHNRQRVRAFVDQLVEKSLLLADTGLLYHGVEPLALAVDALSAMGDQATAGVLDELADRTCRVLSLPSFAQLELGPPWEAAAAAVPALADVPNHHRFHVDLEVAAPDAAIEESCISALQLAAERLIELFPPEDPLAPFKDAFRLRYEDTRAPLLGVLDPDQGVLVASKRRSSRLAGAADLLRPGRSDPTSATPDAAVQALVLAGSGATVDLLADPTIGRRPGGRHAIRVVHAALVDPLLSPYRALLLAAYRLGSLGPLSRFALSADDGATDEAFLRQPGSDAGSDDEGAIVAELLFSPGGRYGNIVLRPQIHRESIAIFGSRGGTLTLDSLDVSLTPGGDVALWHRPTGRRVTVDLNTAHNALAHNNSPVYTFLARAGGWGVTSWRWGALGRLPRLPRIVCGKVIVSPERWLLERKQIDRVLAASHPARELRACLAGFGDRRWLGFGREDNVLLVDTFSDRSVSCLLPRGRETTTTAFLEMPHAEWPAARSDRGGHVSELMVTMPRRGPRPHPVRRPPAFDPTAGRSWVYVRYHCGSGAADQVILHASDVVARLRLAGAIGAWFFVRYDDGVYHVRVRVAPTSRAGRAEAHAALEELGCDLVDRGLVARTVTDTYVPEASRYGGYEGVALAERVFAADSDDVAAYLRTTPDESQRFDRAVLDALAWSGRLAEDATAHVRLLTSWRDSMGIGPTRQTGAFARERRRAMDADPVVEGALGACLDRYDCHLRDFDGRVRRHALGSTMHMHFNRLFETDARRLEWLAYELALRAVRERQARAVGAAAR